MKSLKRQERRRTRLKAAFYLVYLPRFTPKKCRDAVIMDIDRRNVDGVIASSIRDLWALLIDLNSRKNFKEPQAKINRDHT